MRLWLESALKSKSVVVFLFMPGSSLSYLVCTVSFTAKRSTVECTWLTLIQILILLYFLCIFIGCLCYRHFALNHIFGFSTYPSIIITDKPTFGVGLEKISLLLAILRRDWARLRVAILLLLFPSHVALISGTANITHFIKIRDIIYYNLLKITL